MSTEAKRIVKAISEKLQQLHTTLSNSHRIPTDLYQGWQKVAASCQELSNHNRPVAARAVRWIELLDRRIIPDLVELVSLTMRDDQLLPYHPLEPELVSLAISTTTTCMLSARDILEIGGDILSERDRMRSTEVINLIVTAVPMQTATWWTRHRPQASVWVQNGNFHENCHNWALAYITCSFLMSDDQLQEYRESSFGSNTGLMEFMLAFVVYAHNEGESSIVKEAFEVVVSVGCLPDGENEMHILPGLLQAQPHALGVSLSRILKRQPQEGVFKVTHFLFSNLGAAVLEPSLASMGDLAKELGSVMWSCYVQGSSLAERVCFALSTVFVLSAIADASYLSACELTSYLLGQCDFLGMIEVTTGGTLTADRSSDLADLAAENFYINARRFLVSDLSALKAPLKRDFLYFLDFLHPLVNLADSERAQVALRWWEDLGSTVGITEADLRTTEQALRTTSTNTLGCSWLRCVRYDRDCGTHIFFDCAKCQKARYCGILCQERDWVDGGHDKICRVPGSPRKKA